MYPLVKEKLVDPHSIIIDAKSGTSGAGRGAKVPNLFCEVNESIKPYGVAVHRHTPEIEEQLGYAAGEPIMVNFTPHLVPMNRGILATAYASLMPGVTQEQVQEAYEKHYGKEYFIRLLPQGTYPETRWVEGSNFVDIGYKLDPRTHRIIAVGAIDNLVKGAAGQAVQNIESDVRTSRADGTFSCPDVPVRRQQEWEEKDACIRRRRDCAERIPRDRDRSGN